MEKKLIVVVDDTDQTIARMFASVRRPELAGDDLLEIIAKCPKDEVPMIDLREDRREKRFFHQKKRDIFSSKQSITARKYYQKPKREGRRSR